MKRQKEKEEMEAGEQGEAPRINEATKIIQKGPLTHFA